MLTTNFSLTACPCVSRIHPSSPQAFGVQSTLGQGLFSRTWAPRLWHGASRLYCGVKQQQQGCGPARQCKARCGVSPPPPGRQARPPRAGAAWRPRGRSSPWRGASWRGAALRTGLQLRRAEAAAAKRQGPGRSHSPAPLHSPACPSPAPRSAAAAPRCAGAALRRPQSTRAAAWARRGRGLGRLRPPPRAARRPQPMSAAPGAP